MLIIDDNKMKLLKMKEKLLEVSLQNDDNVLQDFEKLAKEIDNDYYNQLIDKIDKCNYNALSLEEQFSFFNEIKEDYNYLNQFQWIIRNKCGEEIHLSDLSNILIDIIDERINNIQGYLINIKNIDNNKKKLDKLNQELVLLDKENDRAKHVMINIKNKLKSDVLRAEGRVYNNDGSMDFVSIASELDAYDVNLKKMLENPDLLEKTFQDFYSEKISNEETLKATIDLPIRDEGVCEQIEFDALKSQYKFKLLELVHEISLCETEYYLLKDSLYKISNIIDTLKDYFRRFGLTFYINPLDRIKIDSQIHVINSMKDYDKEIDNIKKNITYVISIIESETKQSQELIMSINKDIDIIVKRENIVNINEEENTQYEDASDKSLIDIISFDDVKDNQVIKVSDLSDDFKADIVYEKTNGVINRVYEMVYNVPVTYEETTAPELVLESVSEAPLTNDDDNTKDGTTFEDVEIPFEVTLPSLSDIDNEEKLTVDNSNNVFLDDDTKAEVISDNLFHDEVPFDEAPLFSDRYDSGVFDDKKDTKMTIDLSDNKENKQPFENKTGMIKFDDSSESIELNPTMPDAFWVTKEEEPKKEGPSFDEQVAALIQDNEQIKIKKKAA